MNRSGTLDFVVGGVAFDAFQSALSAVSASPQWAAYMADCSYILGMVLR